MTPDRAGVFGGVDTHKDTHVAAAVDAAGRLLGTAEFAADSRGYDQLAGWLQSWGAVGRVGVEGTGSYGAGLTRHLTAAGVEVVEVNRPNRQTRRRRGKTDTVDAETAARAALNGDATAVPKSADGCVEAIRTLSLARRSAVKARTVAANQINAVAVTAPEHLRDRLRGLKTPEMVKVCARWRLDAAGDPAAGAAKRALRALASRHRALTAEIEGLDAELLALCERANPALLGTCGVGAEVASALLVAAGDNPQRMRSEASFAALCGASPIEASSGPRVRHRLNRGGNRQANNALWRIAMVRLRFDERSIDYAARRRAEGKTRREIIRCLKRHIAREIYTGCSPTRPRSHTARACASSAPDAGSPSTPQPKPSTPTPPASQHSNGASTTTATSPNATNGTSPNSRVDKHRSITVDTFIAWSDEILAWHHTDRASNGRIEGTNNLLQVLRRTAHGFTNPANFEARGLLIT